MTKRRRLLALASYPERSAATRFRLTQFLPYLQEHGWDVQFEPFVEDDFFSKFYSAGDRWQKAVHLTGRSLQRLADALGASDFDAVFVQREAALIGPAYAEFVLHAVKRLPIIFDFDDAIWHLDLPRSKHPVAARLLKSPSKCWYTMRRARLVLAGSGYLAKRACEVNSNVEILPTVAPSATWVPRADRLEGRWRSDHVPVIGWVGSHSTAHQLELVAPALARLRAEGHAFKVHVVGADNDFSLESVETRVLPWRLDEEISRFQGMDIGLAPMHGEPVYEGKCGFKQLQYMAVGVPFVTSWVGGVRDFVVDGQNALVARNADEWYLHLKALLESQALRHRLSRNGRAIIESEYCLERQAPRLTEFLERALGHARAS